MSTTPHQEAPGIIFDLDGTLVDTLDDITESINVLFEQQNIARVSRDRVRALIGWGLKNLLLKASGIDDAGRVLQLVEGYRSVYSRRMLNHIRIYPGVPEMLDQLTVMCTPIAVLSNKPDEFTVPMCHSVLGRWEFVACQGAQSEEDRKPNPIKALEYARRMGRSASQVFFVGDSATDAQTAHNAGMTSVAVAWGYRDRSELESAKPDYLIDDPSQIPQILRRMK